MILSPSKLTKTKYSCLSYDIYRSRGSDFYYIIHMNMTILEQGKWKHILQVWNQHYNKDHVSFHKNYPRDWESVPQSDILPKK